MSHTHRASSPLTRVRTGVRRALAAEARRSTTPMHEALAVGLGLAPTPRR